MLAWWNRPPSLGKPSAARTSVCIIGGGPCGLVALKELKERGFNAHLFEKASTIGGAFATAYEGAQFTSSSLISQFSDFCVEEVCGKYWTMEQYLSYLESYVHHFDVQSHVHLEHNVERVSRARGGAHFVVRVAGEPRIFNRVLLATGVNHLPYVPLFEGRETFEGTFVHSSVLPSSRDMHFGGAPQQVMIIGGGETGTDLALMLSKLGHSVGVCVPSLYEQGYFVARYARDKSVGDVNTSYALHGAPSAYRNWFMREKLSRSQRRNGNDVQRLIGSWNGTKEFASTYGVKSASLAEAVLHCGCQVLHHHVKRIKAHSVEFTDGSEFACSVIVCATGFRTPMDHLLAQDVDPNAFGSTDRLYVHTFHPTIRDIAYVGSIRPAYGSQIPLGELQARWVARVWSGEVQLPSVSEMQRSIETLSHTRRRVFGERIADSRSALQEFFPEYRRRRPILNTGFGQPLQVERALHFMTLRGTHGRPPNRAFFSYGAPILIWLAFFALSERTSLQYLLAVMWISHFTKRLLETRYVHLYSPGKQMHGCFTSKASLFYVVFSLAIGWSIHRASYEGHFDAFTTPIVVGYYVSVVVNGMHHYLLRIMKLRSSAVRTFPNGYGFELVACPHYTAECITWLMFALVTHCAASWLFFTTTVGLLIVWSQERYLRYKKMPGYPEHRRALVPFFY